MSRHPADWTSRLGVQLALRTRCAYSEGEGRVCWSFTPPLETGAGGGGQQCNRHIVVLRERGNNIAKRNEHCRFSSP